MKKQYLLVFTTFVMVACLVAGAGASKAAEKGKDWPANISWGSASVGGAYYIWTAAMCKALEKYVGLPASNEPGGSGSSITMMSKGKMHLSSNWMEQTRWAVFGKEIYADKPVKNLRLLFRVYPSPFWIYGRAGLGINSVKDLKGRIFAAEYPPAPLIGYASKLLLKANGMTLKDVKARKVGSVGEAHTGLRDGNFDMILMPLQPGLHDCP